MPTEGLVIDSTAEDAANVPLDLLAYPFVVTGFRTPTPPLQPRWAEPADADGERLVASRYQNREITVSLEIVPTDRTASARAATAEAALAALVDKLAKLNRRGGTLLRTLPSGRVLTFDLLTADQLDPSWDVTWETANALSLELRFAAMPFARGVETPGTVDGFVSNTSADYAISGSGAAISVGRIDVSSTTPKTWIHMGRRFVDGSVTLRFTTGSSVTSWAQQVIGKATDLANHLSVQLTNAGTLAIVKTVGGTPTTLASSAGRNLTASTVYWMRLVMSANVVTGELWTSVPGSGSPSRSVTWTLAGGDLATYGEGVAGFTGFGMTPGGTDWTYTDFSALWLVQEKTLPLLTMAVPGAAGDVPALGRLVLTDLQGVDQQWCVWGLQSSSYDRASTAALFYEAESMTPMGSAALATLSGASGGGSNNAVLERGLTSRWAAILSTQAVGRGSHLTHVGDYRVFARLQRSSANDGVVSVALEWAVGDSQAWTRNAASAFAAGELEDVFTLVDLGIVSLRGDAVRWEGRVIAKSTSSGDDVAVDCLWLVPIERSGEGSGLVSFATPTVFSARDEFDQTPAGALTGKALPIGGTWQGAGDADDFTVTGSGLAQRTVTEDAGSLGDIESARVVVASLSSSSRQAASIDYALNASGLPTRGIYGGVVLRYTDINNFMAFFIYWDSLSVFKRVAGVSSFVYGAGLPAGTQQANVFLNITAAADTVGRAVVYVGPPGGAPTFTGALWDASLAAGGRLASGKAGIIDSNFDDNVVTRSYDNFTAWVPTADAAIFAGQSAQFAHDGVIREDATGLLQAPMSREAGDRLLLPVAGPEGVTTRFAVKASRSNPGEAPDIAIDDLMVQLYATPRFLQIP